MINTVVQEIILNAKIMDKDDFLDWFWQNKDLLIKKEKEQISNAYESGNNLDNNWQPEDYYYKETFQPHKL